MPPSLTSPSPPLSSSPYLSPHLSSHLSSSRISLSPITATRVRCRPFSLSAGHRSSPLAARRYHSSPAPRRSLRLAAQAQARADRFGLTGLIILPIPDIQGIAAAISRHAEERRDQLLAGTSTQETLIYHSATTAHINALNRRDSIYPGRITFFGNESGLLYFRMPLPLHEMAHLYLYDEIRHLINRMGLRYAIRPTGSSTYKGIGSKKKEGDGGIRPDPPRWAGDHFPTLVMEAGNSESLQLLHRDKDWWFDNSPPGQPRGDVVVVLLIKMERHQQRILVEQWYRGQQSPFHTVAIIPHPDKPLILYDASHWVVEGAPMIIPFEHVFLRPPTGPRETNLVLTGKFFINLGMHCWQSSRTHDDA